MDKSITPAISVIISSQNRSALLGQTLQSIRAMPAISEPWELIVVDNDSTDDTAEVLAKYADTLPLTVIFEHQHGTSRAKNRALDAAKGELIVFTDDDVVVEPDWLSALVEAAYRWPEVGIFGGRIKPVLPDTLPRWLKHQPTLQDRVARNFAYYFPQNHEGPTRNPPLGPNTLIRRSTLAAERFDESRGPDGTADYVQSSDTDLIQRLMSQGAQIVFVPSASLDHIVRPEQITLEGMNARAYRRGRKNALTDPTRHAGYSVAGATPRLWWWWMTAWCRCAVIRLVSQGAKRLDAEDRLAFRRGFLDKRRESSKAHNRDNMCRPTS